MSDPLPPESAPEPSLPPAAPTPPPAPEPPSVPEAPVVSAPPEAVPPADSVPPPPAGFTEANWGMAIHLTPLLAVFVCCAPGAAIIGPLIIWLIKRPESVMLDEIGKRVLNFQVSYAIYSLGSVVAATILSFVGIGFLLTPVSVVIALAWLIFTILGAVKQNKGEAYQPPLTLDLIK